VTLDLNSQNFPEFQWTKGRSEAAVLLAEDELNDEQIAERAGVSRRQLTTWKQHPTFRARIDELAAEFEQSFLRIGIARKRRRIAALNDRHQRMCRVIEERAADPEMQEVAGGTTGLLVRQVKVIGTGEHARTVEEYAVDTGLLSEMRQTEKQMAQEVGDWVDKSEARTTNTNLSIVEVRAVDYRAAITSLRPAEAE
jgi:hypothetical protein